MPCCRWIGGSARGRRPRSKASSAARVQFWSASPTGDSSGQDFMPTFLHLSASSALSGYLREIVGLLSHRGDQLALAGQQRRTDGTAERTISGSCNASTVRSPFSGISTAPPMPASEILCCLLGLVANWRLCRSRKRPAEFSLRQATRTRFLEPDGHARQALAWSWSSRRGTAAAAAQVRLSVSHIPRQKPPPRDFRSGLWEGDMDSEPCAPPPENSSRISSVERIRDMVGCSCRASGARPAVVRADPLSRRQDVLQAEISSVELAQLSFRRFRLHVSGHSQYPTPILGLKE